MALVIELVVRAVGLSRDEGRCGGGCEGSGMSRWTWAAESATIAFPTDPAAAGGVIQRRASVKR